MKNNYVRIRNGAYLVNTYAIYFEDKAVLIDPGKCADKAEKLLNGHIPVAVYLTHGHIDHFYEADFFREKYGAKIYIHEADVKYLANTDLSFPVETLPKGYTLKTITHDFTFKDDDFFVFGEDTYTVIHTPGHTEGSCCFYCDGVLFSGDTLFCGDVGRTDFPLGNKDKMKESIKRLLTLPPKTTVECGHGYKTTIAAEKNLSEIDF